MVSSFGTITPLWEKTTIETELVRIQRTANRIFFMIHSLTA
jgi:hypothetical protein